MSIIKGFTEGGVELFNVPRPKAKRVSMMYAAVQRVVKAQKQLHPHLAIVLVYAGDGTVAWRATVDVVTGCMVIQP